MLENGTTIFSMAKVWKIGKMEAHMKETSSVERKMGMVFRDGQMGRSIWENGFII